MAMVKQEMTSFTCSKGTERVPISNKEITRLFSFYAVRHPVASSCRAKPAYHSYNRVAFSSKNVDGISRNIVEWCPARNLLRWLIVYNDAADAQHHSS